MTKLAALKAHAGDAGRRACAASVIVPLTTPAVVAREARTVPQLDSASAVARLVAGPGYSDAAWAAIFGNANSCGQRPVGVATDRECGGGAGGRRAGGGGKGPDSGPGGGGPGRRHRSAAAVRLLRGRRQLGGRRGGGPTTGASRSGDGGRRRGRTRPPTSPRRWRSSGTCCTTQSARRGAASRMRTRRSGWGSWRGRPAYRRRLTGSRPRALVV
eukprot:6192763-Pleurochrysis_carterae.AAC.1